MKRLGVALGMVLIVLAVCLIGPGKVILAYMAFGLLLTMPIMVGMRMRRGKPFREACHNIYVGGIVEAYDMASGFFEGYPVVLRQMLSGAMGLTMVLVLMVVLWPLALQTEGSM